MHKKFVAKATVSVPDHFQGFHNMHFNYLCRWNSPTFLWEVIEGKESRHFSNLKVIFLRPEQKKVRVIILNERSLAPRMLPWQPSSTKIKHFFLYNFPLLEFQWIRFSNYWVIVNLITQSSTCKLDDVIIFTVVVVCSELILSVMFRPFKRRYLWNQIRCQKTVNSVHSCFSCTFIWENKNFRFISTLTIYIFSTYLSIHIYALIAPERVLFISYII